MTDLPTRAGRKPPPGYRYVSPDEAFGERVCKTPGCPEEAEYDGYCLAHHPMLKLSTPSAQLRLVEALERRKEAARNGQVKEDVLETPTAPEQPNHVMTELRAETIMQNIACSVCGEQATRLVSVGKGRDGYRFQYEYFCEKDTPPYARRITHGRVEFRKNLMLGNIALDNIPMVGNDPPPKPEPNTDHPVHGEISTRVHEGIERLNHLATVIGASEKQIQEAVQEWNEGLDDLKIVL